MEKLPGVSAAGVGAASKEKVQQGDWGREDSEGVLESISLRIVSYPLRSLQPEAGV
jgi:hypothetical protein